MTHSVPREVLVGDLAISHNTEWGVLTMFWKSMRATLQHSCDFNSKGETTSKAPRSFTYDHASCVVSKNILPKQK